MIMHVAEDSDAHRRRLPGCLLTRLPPRRFPRRASLPFLNSNNLSLEGESNGTGVPICPFR